MKKLVHVHGSQLSNDSSKVGYWCSYNIPNSFSVHVLLILSCHMTTGVDVIGLLETDAARPYIGNHDLASWLAERLHMHVDYGPGTKDHTWG